MIYICFDLSIYVVIDQNRSHLSPLSLNFHAGFTFYSIIL